MKVSNGIPVIITTENTNTSESMRKNFNHFRAKVENEIAELREGVF